MVTALFSSSCLVRILSYLCRSDLLGIFCLAVWICIFGFAMSLLSSPVRSSTLLFLACGGIRGWLDSLLVITNWSDRDLHFRQASIWRFQVLRDNAVPVWRLRNGSSSCYAGSCCLGSQLSGLFTIGGLSSRWFDQVIIIGLFFSKDPKTACNFCSSCLWICCFVFCLTRWKNVVYIIVLLNVFSFHHVSLNWAYASGNFS